MGTGTQASVLAFNQLAVALASKRRLDEALTLLDQALTMNPRHAPSHNNRGAVQMMRGDLKAAAESYALALSLDSSSAKAHFNLANIYRSLGRTERAIDHLTRVLALNPEHHSASHMLAATRGTTTERAPIAYVRELFDQYAATFERVLTADLEYRTPRMLRELLLTQTERAPRFVHAVDLGCGTGLSGLEFRDHVDAMAGVDLSACMLEKAREKGIYASLHRVEMVEYLRASHESHDLLVAADALIYMGNLAPLFDSVAERALSSAWFLFSVEHSAEASYTLTPSGRYAHSSAYVHALAAEREMTVTAVQRAVLRKDAGRDVVGELFAVRTRAR